jgi:hypothetical protein
MRKRAAGLIAAILVVAIAGYASDPWKDKDPQSWDEKDVQKILQDSPWSHKVQFGMSGGGSVPGAVTATGGSTGGGKLNDPSKSVDNGGNGPMTPGGDLGPRSEFNISWISARTVREAQARRMELGGVSHDMAQRELAKPVDDYEVMVASLDMRAVARGSEGDLKAQTFLIVKSTKAKISPKRVEFQNGPTGRLAAIIFVFEKKVLNGEPTFALDEKGVEFVTQARKTPLRVSFDFTKMRNKQGLDL